MQPGRPLLEQRDGHGRSRSDTDGASGRSRHAWRRRPSRRRRAGFATRFGAARRGDGQGRPRGRAPSSGRRDRLPLRRDSPSRRTAGPRAPPSARSSEPERRGIRAPATAFIIRNSSALDVPNTPPCSMRTTKRSPSDSSTNQFSRELPVAMRSNSLIFASLPRRTCSHDSSAARSASSIEPPAERLDERRRRRQLFVELANDHGAQQRCGSRRRARRRARRRGRAPHRHHPSPTAAIDRLPRPWRRSRCSPWSPSRRRAPRRIPPTRQDHGSPRSGRGRRAGWPPPGPSRRRRGGPAR